MKLEKRMDAIRKAITDDPNDATEQLVDTNALIIGTFLQGYVAVDKFGSGVVVMTTDEIISSLSDMADLEQSDVNRVLATNGYKPGRNSVGSFGWLMKPIDL